MYRPDHFRVDDLTQMHALMREHPLATLVSMGSQGLDASHLPTVLKNEAPRGVVEGYITPNWYPSKIEHQKVVPTWNYVVVHAYGRPEVVHDQEWLRRHVPDLIEQQEMMSQPKPWAVTDAPESFLEAMLRGIVGFRFAITRLEGKWKMSQNRDAADRAGVIRGLERRAEGDDLAIAAMGLAPPDPK